MERIKLSYKERWFLAYNETFEEWCNRNEKNREFIIPRCDLDDIWTENGIPLFQDEIKSFKNKGK